MVPKGVSRLHEVLSMVITSDWKERSSPSAEFIEELALSPGSPVEPGSSTIRGPRNDKLLSRLYQSLLHTAYFLLLTYSVVSTPKMFGVAWRG